MPPRSLFSLAFQRRIAKAALHRRLPPLRPLHSTLPSLAVLPKLSPIEAPNSTALSALLSRLSLRSDPSLHPALLACLTHPSFSSSPRIPTNEVLSSLGNALLGLFASEHLAYLFPLLPTEALKSAVTAYVGPNACFSVARELGVAVQAGGNMGLMGEGAGMASAGVALRWKKEEVVVDGPERTPVAKRFRRFRGKQSGQGLDRSAGQEAQETGQEDQAKHRTHGRESFEEMVATSVKAFVGLIYQERGIHAARTFTHAHFLTRHLDLASLFSFKNPKHVLSSVVARHLIEAGVHPSNGMGRIESRLLASTGAQSQAPLFNVGIFTSFGLKLGEGHGSSLRMAEHRAAVNALLAHFLVRGDQARRAGPVPATRSGLPSSAHVAFPVDGRGLLSADGERFEGGGFGGRETVVESGRAGTRGGRLKGAARTTAL